MSDLVVNAKAKKEEWGSGPCGKECKLCRFMVETNEVKDKKGEMRRIKNKVDCRTTGAIYGITCKECEKVVYVFFSPIQFYFSFILHDFIIESILLIVKHPSFFLSNPILRFIYIA